MSANTIYSQVAASGAAVGASFPVNRTIVGSEDIVQDLAWTVSGTCSFKIQTSWDQVTWVDVGSALSSTGSADAQTLRTFIRVNVLSATSATITVTCTDANTCVVRDSKDATNGSLTFPVVIEDFLPGKVGDFTVQVLDEDGIPVCISGIEVTVSLGSGTGTPSGTLTVATEQNGIAYFYNVYVNDGSGTLVFTATAGSLTGDSNSVDVLSAAPFDSIVVTAQPVGVIASDTFLEEFDVQLMSGETPVELAGVAATVTVLSGGITIGGTVQKTSDVAGGFAFDSVEVLTIASPPETVVLRITLDDYPEIYVDTDPFSAEFT